MVTFEGLGAYFLLTLVLYSLYQFFLYPFVLFLKLGFAIGFDHVGIIYHPLSPYKSLHKEGTNKYGHSFGQYLDAVKKNPLIKVIVNKIIVVNRIIVCDTEMIKKINFDYHKHVEKKRFVAFIDEMSKGLLFEEGDEWKNSRNIISNLFHFEKLKQRQYLMDNVIQHKIENLDGSTPDLLKLGSSIGGETVVKSLFGEQYFKIQFGENNPYEQMRDLFYIAMEESSKIGNVLRLVLFKRQLSKDCLFLTQSQKSFIQRITKLKDVSRQFLFKQRDRLSRGQSISPFIQGYFKQKNDDTYIQQIIHQLLFFLFAGQDTTGSLIQMCLCLLARYPQYQSRILQNVQETSVHNSKQLNNFINEVTRLHNVLTINFPRKVVTPFEIDGVKFYKGLEVVLLLGGPMINPRYWDNPYEFNPDRFNKAVENPGTFIPFMSGPRNCIGQHMAIMQVRVTIAKILEKYNLEKVGNSLETTTLGIINHMKDKHYVKFVQK